MSYAIKSQIWCVFSQIKRFTNQSKTLLTMYTREKLEHIIMFIAHVE